MSSYCFALELTGPPFSPQTRKGSIRLLRFSKGPLGPLRGVPSAWELWDSESHNNILSVYFWHLPVGRNHI